RLARVIGTKYVHFPDRSQVTDIEITLRTPDELARLLGSTGEIERRGRSAGARRIQARASEPGRDASALGLWHAREARRVPRGASRLRILHPRRPRTGAPRSATARLLRGCGSSSPIPG